MGMSERSQRPAPIASLFPKLSFDPGRVVAEFCPTSDLEGQPGWVQGGFVATVLDYVCAAAASEAFSEQAITGRLSLRYISPVLIAGGPYSVTATMDDSQPRSRPPRHSVRIEGVVVDEAGSVLVTAAGLFVRRGLSA